jgi:hypothetical protein
VLGRLKPPKVADCEIDILSEAEIARIIGILDYHTEIGARDLAIFCTLLDSGIRAGELTALRLSDLHLDQGYMVVFGKGRKERPVKVGSRAIKALRFYLAHWRKPSRPNPDRVFLSVGRPMGKYEDLFACGVACHRHHASPWRPRPCGSPSSSLPCSATLSPASASQDGSTCRYPSPHTLAANWLPLAPSPRGNTCCLSKPTAIPWPTS